ncbi:Phytochrome two-component sensor histidine kinase Cyanobacterial phytochrome B [Paramagnetospirillum magnetotacticum MS-1]|uniref:histidine kinase n=1 Tax=Paramagnetospirillum magnetotacticum MS-1 TaxID=272627 RepID=A0A0C2YLL2_PARME|nr:ATP-binding protein [Paramagnetospirillum magnetotacticum]KIM00680.1 Phytochrome two-component sensor histidine kinase Cyanobacterial phytochrome B [Paramagnetospirillum magnetotacticum MS-1]
MLLATVVWLGLSWWITAIYSDHREAQLRGQASALAQSSAGALGNALNQRLALVRGLAAFMAVKAAENHPEEIDLEFPAFASACYQQVPGIRNISVAPDFVVRLVYPQDAGNLKVVGNHLLDDKRPGFAEAVNRAIKTRDLAVHEPVELIQGGLGLMARQAIFVDERPWGAVGMAFSIASLLDSGLIDSMRTYIWGLRTKSGTLVGGDAGVFAMQPVLVPIALPEGYWEFALAPRMGWAKATAEEAEIAALRFGLLIIGIGLLTLTWIALRRRETLEKLVESRTRELSNANRELERFSFVVAHDLQEPLRSIVSFSQLVERGMSDQLTPEHREWLSGLANAARLMKSLLHDVQIYLGESNAPLPKRQIDAAEALAMARRKLSGPINQSGATLEVSPLPMVWADHHRLSEAFLALIGNAIEYRSPERPAVIRISSRMEGTYLYIDIADNGIGIEEMYFERIFDVFQRLHARSAHPGTGMGLAIAKKMVEHLGGTIRVRSQIGQGSVFSIVLPAARTRSVDARWERP